MKSFSKIKLLKITGHGAFGLISGGLIASPFIWSTTAISDKLPIPKLNITNDDVSATLSMVMQPYKGFIEEFKDLKIKFTNDKTETKILSFVENNGWNEKNIDQFTSETNILINKGAFPTDTHTPLSLILTPNTNPKQQHISFQAFVWYFRNDNTNYTQISNIIDCSI